MWSQTNLSYAQRANNLSNGSFPLNATTVFDDAAFDMLTGSAGMDWFFASALDKVTDHHPAEIFT